MSVENLAIAKNEEEKTKHLKNKAEEILSAFNIKKGEPIPLETIRKIIIKYGKEIEEGIARNFYNQIKGSLAVRRWQNMRSANYVLRRAGGESSDKYLVDFIWYLQNGEVEDRKPALIFTYSMSAERADKEANKNYSNFYSGYEAFNFEKVALGVFDFQKLDRKETREKIPSLNNATFEPRQSASYDNFKHFLEKVTQEMELFPEANLAIWKIWKKYKLPKSDAEKLKQAILEFGNFIFKNCESNRNSFHLIGQCLTIPGEFEYFMKQRFGIHLDRCELTGARKRRQGYSSQERAELTAGAWGSEVHEASIYKDTVIIDWTSRQFGQKIPVPEIYDLNSKPALKQRIEIYKDNQK